MKGCGEAGCAGSLVSVNNAIADALYELGIKNLEMPATPERVWQAIQSRRAAQAAWIVRERRAMPCSGSDVASPRFVINDRLPRHEH